MATTEGQSILLPTLVANQYNHVLLSRPTLFAIALSIRRLNWRRVVLERGQNERGGVVCQREPQHRQQEQGVQRWAVGIVEGRGLPAVDPPCPLHVPPERVQHKPHRLAIGETVIQVQPPLPLPVC